jgi:lauroyl/myristoyl acyltransferase
VVILVWFRIHAEQEKDVADRNEYLSNAKRAVRSVRQVAGLLVRRCLPSALVPVVVIVRAGIARRRPARVADAEAGMRLVVGDERPADEIHELAHRYLHRMAWRGETRWHPEWINDQPVDGLEHLREALTAGRGCILSFVHHADWEGTFPSIARNGIAVDALGGSAMFEGRPPLWVRQQKKVVESVEGSVVVNVEGGTRMVLELSARGCVVAIAMDVPGHTPVRYLGHDLRLSSGGSRIAVDDEVPVVVLTSRRDPMSKVGGARIALLPPLMPSNFSSPADLLNEMASCHERAVLAWPEAMDRPATLLDQSLVRQPTVFRDPSDPEHLG